MEKYARKCSITGKGMNEGYCFGDGEMYCINKKDAIKIAKERGSKSLKEAFEDEDYYYTTWEELDEDENYLADGTLVDMTTPFGKLCLILNKMDDNLTSLWSDTLEDTVDCIVLSDVPQEDAGIIKYNGWSEDLVKLFHELKDLEGEQDK